MIRGARRCVVATAGGDPGWFGDIQQTGPVTFSSGTKEPIVTHSSMVTVNGKQVNFGNLPADKAEQIKAAFGMMDQMLTPMVMTSGDGDLTDRLEELKEARDKGLITEDEYQQVRKAILDSLGK